MVFTAVGGASKEASFREKFFQFNSKQNAGSKIEFHLQMSTARSYEKRLIMTFKRFTNHPSILIADGNLIVENSGYVPRRLRHRRDNTEYRDTERKGRNCRKMMLPLQPNIFCTCVGILAYNNQVI